MSVFAPVAEGPPHHPLAGNLRRGSTDRLTIGRLMLITAGIAVGLVVFVPEPEKAFEDAQHVRLLLGAILLGATLPGLVFVAERRRQRRRIGVGGWIALTSGLGVLILLPPSLAASRFGGGEGLGLLCLHYTIPLAMLFMLLASIAAGRLRWRHLNRSAPWSERYGFYLALAWLPLSLWLLWDIYTDSLF
jgi:hypothetical protein